MKTYKIIFSLGAKLDLVNIYDYISKDSLNIASNLQNIWKKRYML